MSEYKSVLDRHLLASNVNVSLCECCDLRCNKCACTEKIDTLYNVISNSCDSAAKVAIPHSKPSGSKKGNIPIKGWNEHVKPHRERALLWHRVWKDSGSPREGYIAQIMRKTRAQYHAAVKWVKRNQTAIRNEKLAMYLNSRDSSNLWGEVKKAKGANNSMPSTVDGVSGNNEIANLFANKFKTLFNSVAYDDADMERLDKRLDSLIQCSCMNGLCKNHNSSVTVADVYNGIKLLKPGKKDGMSDLVL